MSIRRLPSRDPERTIRAVVCDQPGCSALISARRLRERQLNGHLADWARLDDRHYCAAHALKLLGQPDFVALKWFLVEHPEHQVDPAWVDEQLWEPVEGIDLSALDPGYGRALDLRIARDFLGLTVRQKRKPSARTGEWVEVFDYWDGARWQPVMNYSTDTSAAFKYVRPELRRRGLTLSMIDAPADAPEPDSAWEVAILNGERRSCDGEAQGALAQAICLAALAAIEERDD